MPVASEVILTPPAGNVCLALPTAMTASPLLSASTAPADLRLIMETVWSVLAAPLDNFNTNNHVCQAALSEPIQVDQPAFAHALTTTTSTTRYAS